MFGSMDLISYIDGPRLRKSLVAACDFAQTRRQELNRINVFPVPDGDTGTNLTLTVRAIVDGLRGVDSESVGVVAVKAAEASVLGARGNCGMMLSHFLLGFAEPVREMHRIGTRQFAQALTAGVERLQGALDNPVEGTMLTVMRDTATAARESESDDFASLLRKLRDAAGASLARTPEFLPVLKKAGVVDAGGKGFLSLIEGVVSFIDGDPITEVGEQPDFSAIPAAVTAVEYPTVEESYRFCTEALVRGRGLPTSDQVREALGGLGDSLIVILADEVLKLHIHTDDPESVFSYLRTVGSLAAHKAEDMRAQHEAVGRAAGSHVTLARRPISIVTDSAADLPRDVIRQHGIHVVPLMLMEGDTALRDGVDVTAEEFHRRMEDGESIPTTSQPAPGAFLEAYKRAAEDGEQIINVALGSALSGTMASGEAAAALFEGTPVHVFDTRAASSLQALLVLKAAELGELGMSAQEIVSELGRIRDRSNVLFTVDTFDRLLASGRVGRGRALLGGLLGVKPILGLTAEGKVVPFGKALGRARVRGVVMDHLEEAIPTGAKVRFALAHVAAEDKLDEVEAELVRRYGAVDVMRSPATPVVATHTGPGAWALAYMVED